MEIQRYAQRLLNPFRGVMQVIRYGPAEAVSMDGVHWDIYVANDTLLEGLQDDAQAQVSDIRYGRWSAEGGLKRGPLYPSEDFRRMEAMGARVYQSLQEDHGQVPFPLMDRLELWLLDEVGHPLALLDSALQAPDRPDMELPRWRAGRSAHAAFASMTDAGLENHVNPADRLDDYINRLAGPQPRARWYQRNSEGCGRCLDPDQASLIEAAAFPPLLIRQHGHDPIHGELLEQYLDWQAVWLLCLPGLPVATRRHLEARARLQAGLVEANFRLYPDIIDPALLNAARVEARLLGSRACSATGDEGDDDGSTFYIELSPAGGGYT